MNRILILNGPNLNMLGSREIDKYGEQTWPEIMAELEVYAINHDIQLSHKQSNHEGVLVDEIQAAGKAANCVILNAGALSHYSYALRDAIASIKIPVIEVHMSNIYSRESFRCSSVITPVCCGLISGFKSKSYLLALQAGISIIKSNIN